MALVTRLEYIGDINMVLTAMALGGLGAYDSISSMNPLADTRPGYHKSTETIPSLHQERNE